MASAASCCTCTHTLLLHFPNPTHLLLPSPALHRGLRLSLPSSAAARSRPERSAISRPLAFEAATEEEESPRWFAAEAGSDYGYEEEGWVGGSGAARGEDRAAEDSAGEGALSGWKPRQPRPRELFVCNLPRRCGVEDIIELFRPYGAVLSAEISRDAETGISRGCGFVTMRSLAEARTAMNALDGFNLDGREMLVKLASDVVSSRRNLSLSHTPPVKDHIFESPHKIYVGNISWSVQPQHLRDYFAQCGTIVSTRLLTDRKGGRSRLYGFVSFSSAEELEAALQLNNTNFHGRDIIVRAAHVDRQTQ